MKYGLALLAAATGALAAWNGTSNGTVAYTTMVVTALTTFCPYATKLTHNGITYTVTEATTLTITDCPCTVTRPIHTPSTVLYTSCPPGAETPPAKAPPANAPPACTPPACTPPANAPPAPMPANPPYPNPLTPSEATPAVKPNGGFATGTVIYPTQPGMITGAARANKVGGMLVGAVAGIAAMAV